MLSFTLEVQIYRVIDIHINSVSIEALFDITNIEASELPPLAARLFQLLAKKQRDKPPAARSVR